MIPCPVCGLQTDCVHRKLDLANEEIRHAYNDNETHRGRITELEAENARLREEAKEARVQRVIDDNTIFALRAVVEAAKKAREILVSNRMIAERASDAFDVLDAALEKVEGKC